ncbi:unnamed protein product [Prorocentrum cordatum]|uniref:Uncharacterized protein n=1 Tax=Prorocentrum cordatum TaxID=2364126 RepID=A0ABN9WRZ9_9DINO|nr:unnamed protein product [Polarella glacialis]
MPAGLTEFLVQEAVRWAGLTSLFHASRWPEAPACPAPPPCPELPPCPACPVVPPGPARPSLGVTEAAARAASAGFGGGVLCCAVAAWALGACPQGRGQAAGDEGGPVRDGGRASGGASPVARAAGRRVVGRRRSVHSATELGALLIGTPDLDVYEEDYRPSSLGTDIVQVVFSAARWPPPAGAPRAQAYRFRDDLTGLELAAMQDAARDQAAGGAGAPVPADAFVPLPAIAGVLATEAPAASAGGRPLAVPGGAPVPIAGGGPPAAPAQPWWQPLRPLPGQRLPRLCRRQPRLEAIDGLVTYEVVAPPSGHAAFAALVSESEVAQFKRELKGSDMRSLPVMRTAIDRERPWAFVVTDCTEEDIADFGAKPPRSAKGCAAYQQKDGGPMLRSEMRKARRRLQDSSHGVGEHGTLSIIVETLGTVDQLDVYNLAGVEVAYRKLQMIEYY